MNANAETIADAFASAARAYEADLKRVGDRVTLVSAEQDVAWLLAAARLEHARSLAGSRSQAKTAEVAEAVRRVSRGKAVADSILDGSGELEAPFHDLILWAERVEVAGGYALALNILVSGATILHGTSPRAFALSLVQRGRILRTLGAHREAEDAYRFAISAAQKASFPVAAGRAAIGLAATLYQQGRVKPAIRAYTAALRHSRHNATLVSLAELGLCAAAVQEGRLREAARHAVRSLAARPSNKERRAEVFYTLAQVCLRTGAPDLALRAAQRIVAMSIQARTRLIAASLGAVAAARLDDRKSVDAMCALVRRLSNAETLPYQTSGSWMLVSRARQILGDSAAARQALSRARRLAVEHRYGALEADAEQLLHDLAGGQALSARERSRIRTTLAAV